MNNNSNNNINSSLNNINNISKTFMTGTPNNLKRDKLFNNSVIQNSGKTLHTNNINNNNNNSKSYIDSGSKPRKEKSKSKSKNKKTNSHQQSSKHPASQVYSPTQFKYPKKIQKRHPSGFHNINNNNIWILNSNSKVRKNQYNIKIINSLITLILLIYFLN